MDKKLVLWGVIGLLIVTGVTAELVDYYFGKTEVTFEVNETGAFGVTEKEWTNFSMNAGDGYVLKVWGAVNNLPTNESVNVSVNLQEYDDISGQWVNVTNDEGFYIAFSDNLKCCLPGYCNPLDDMTNVTDCKVDHWRWMRQNAGWVWWYTTSNLTEAYNSTVVRHTQITSQIPFENGVVKFPTEMHPGQFYGWLYIGTDARLKGGQYKLLVEV